MLWLGITLIFCFLQVLMTPLFPLPDFSGLQAAAQIPSFLPCIPLPRSGLQTEATYSVPV